MYIIHIQLYKFNSIRNVSQKYRNNESKCFVCVAMDKHIHMHLIAFSESEILLLILARVVWNSMYPRTIETHHSEVHLIHIYIFVNWLCIWCFYFFICFSFLVLPTFRFSISITIGAFARLCVRYTSILIRLIRIKFFISLSCSGGMCDIGTLSRK